MRPEDKKAKLSVEDEWLEEEDFEDLIDKISAKPDEVFVVSELVLKEQSTVNQKLKGSNLPNSIFANPDKNKKQTIPLKELMFNEETKKWVENPKGKSTITYYMQ